MGTDIKTDVFRNNWIRHNYEIFTSVYPLTSKKKIMKFLNDVYDRDFEDQPCECINNYDQVSWESTLSRVVDWIETEKPILTESGTFFKRHSIAYNPDGIIMDMKLKERKIEKNKQFDYMEKSIAEKAEDKKEYLRALSKKSQLAQLRIKVIVNSIYGASGMPSSWLYNIACASATTTKAQHMISVTFTTFENFLTDSVGFMDMDECLTYMNNILKNKPTRNINDYINGKIPNVELFARLRNKFINRDDCDTKVLERFISSLSEKDKKILYYKNNIYRAIDNSPYMQKLMCDITGNSQKYLDPMKLPSRTADAIVEFTSVLTDFCLYEHLVYDSRYRLQTQKRKCVRVIDTDSNFIDLSEWYDYCKRITDQKIRVTGFKYRNGNILVPSMKSEEIKKREEKEFATYTIINTMTYVLSNVIEKLMYKFVKSANVEDGTIGTISFKNEFYFPRLLLTVAKKHYMGIFTLKEGRHIYPPEAEIKGMEYMKRSYASPKTKKFISDLVYNDILCCAGTPDTTNILDKIYKFEKTIKKSVLNSEFDFLKDIGFKPADNYDDPWSVGTWKACNVWNLLYPNKEIKPHERAYLLKVKLEKKKDFADLSVNNPEMFERLLNIFESEPRIAKSGINTIGIPVDETIPEWVKPYINIDEIVINNTELLLPIMNSLKIRAIYKRASDKYLSNIIEFR